MHPETRSLALIRSCNSPNVAVQAISRTNPYQEYQAEAVLPVPSMSDQNELSVIAEDEEPAERSRSSLRIAEKLATITEPEPTDAEINVAYPIHPIIRLKLGRLQRQPTPSILSFLIPLLSLLIPALRTMFLLCRASLHHHHHPSWTFQIRQCLNRWIPRPIPLLQVPPMNPTANQLNLGSARMVLIKMYLLLKYHSNSLLCHDPVFTCACTASQVRARYGTTAACHKSHHTWSCAWWQSYILAEESARGQSHWTLEEIQAMLPSPVLGLIIPSRGKAVNSFRGPSLSLATRSTRSPKVLKRTPLPSNSEGTP